MDPREEEELRRLIRKELENRERLRRQPGGEHGVHVEEGGMSEERRWIIEQEIEAFYRDRGGYQRFENEDGEVEWLTEQEIREREHQLPVDMEELEVGQRKVRNRILLLSLLAFVVVVLLLVVTRDRTGSVQVICNVPGAIVHLNGSETGFVTDARIEKLPVGPHLISVSKFGYVPDGPSSRQVDVRAGSDEIVVLKLKPQTMDSLGRPR